MSPHDEKRRRLFSLYATNLSAYVPDVRDHFVCPLCMDGFDRECLEVEGEQSVTLEHCIPRFWRKAHDPYLQGVQQPGGHRSRRPCAAEAGV